jgi:16S rRNA (uracil1498-N3)-methyltransferase
VVAEPVQTAELAARLSTAALALVLHETATESLAGVDLPVHGNVVVVVGPEGGITDTELAALVAAGGRPVRLGPEVLRSSTAGPAALAVLASLARWR